METPVGEVSEVRHYPMGATTIPYPNLSKNRIKASLQITMIRFNISLSVFIFFTRSWHAFKLDSEATRLSI